MSQPRLGGSACRPDATSWTKAAQPNKLRSERSVGKPTRQRHPLSGRRYNKEGTGPQGVDLHRTHTTELLQRSSIGTDVPPCILKCFQCVRERLLKSVISRMYLHVFPPTTTETRINPWLEVITPTGEGGK